MNTQAIIRTCFFIMLVLLLFTTAASAQEACPWWQIESINLVVELDPLRGLMKGDACLRLKNSGSGSEDILLNLNHELAVDSVSGETDLPLPYERTGEILAVHPLKPISTLGAATIRVRYQGSFHEPVPELDLHNAWIGPQVSYAFYSSRWYPQTPGPFRRCRGKITYLVPENWTVASSGRLTAADTMPGVKQYTFTIVSPVEFSFAAAAFVHHRENIDGLDVGVFLLAGGREKIDFYLEHCVKLVRFFREFYGFFPYDGYSLIELSPDLLGKAGAGSYEGLTFYPSGILPDHFFYTPVFAHEISHCWWGNCVRGAEGPVINEGLAQISMGLYLEHVLGKKIFWEMLKNGAPDYLLLHSARLFFRALQFPKIKDQSILGLLLRGEDLQLGIPARDKFTTLHMLANSKGSFIYAMLRELIGPDAFRQGLRGALEQFAWKNMTLEDLRLQFEKASGRDLKWFFGQWFERQGAPEFSMSCTITARSNKIWLVRGTITQLRDVYWVKAEIASFRNTFRETRYIEINARETPFSFLVSFKPQAVRFDPDYKILRWSKEFNFNLI